jgi:DNA-binding CsgD family transcriptional regulator
MVCCNVGLIAEHLGFAELCLEFTELAWSILPDGSTKALAGVCSGAALCQLERLDEARARLESSLALLRADVSSIAWLDASSALCWVDARQGHAGTAIPALLELVAIADASGLYSSSSRAREVLAEAYLMVSKPKEALAILETAMPVISSLNANVASESCKTLARAYAAVGRWQDAYEVLAKPPAPLGATFAIHESFVLLLRLVLSSDASKPQGTGGQAVSLNRQLAAGTTAIARRLGLTPADLRLVALLVDGKSNMELAQSLGVSANTVRNRLARVMSKLGVRTRAGVVSKVVEAGLVIR